MTEEAVDRIDGDASTIELPERWRAAVEWADVVIGDQPARPDRTARVVAALTRAERAELTLTVAVAQGFSKAAIAWGPAPELPTMVIPTPGS